MAKQRIEEIDLLKGVLITLMVIFHLSYFGDKYPYAKDLVYSFHMPGFLMVSGYFAAAWQSVSAKNFFAKRMLWLLIPYLVMEFAYATLSAFMPVRGGLETFGALPLLDALMLHPVGPYWYLHTLMLCSAVWFLASGISPLRRGGQLLLAFSALAAIALSGWGILSFNNILFFMLGAAYRCFVPDFRTLLKPSLWWFAPIVVLCALVDDGATLRRWTLPITLCAVPGIMGIGIWMRGSVKRATLFVGRNSLSVLLFSPIFTMLSKQLLPLFAFDTTGLCFMLTATALTLAGSLAITWTMDRCGISPYFFGRKMMD